MIKLIFKTVLVGFVLLVVIGLFTGGGPGTSSPSGDTVTSSPPRGTVSAAQFGDRWPFTVDSGRLRCDRPSRALFTAGGKTYGINGAATMHGFAPIDPIWRDEPEIPGAKVNIGPMIERALALC